MEVKRKTVTSTAVKRRYNAKHYASITVQLDKELIGLFKERVKEKGDTIAEIIRAAIQEYLSK